MHLDSVLLYPTTNNNLRHQAFQLLHMSEKLSVYRLHLKSLAHANHQDQFFDLKLENDY